MTCVFISGSRSINRLNDTIRQRLSNITRQNFDLVIGDANGADKAVQQWLHAQGYTQVTVYCAGQKCRNNIGSWPVVQVEVGDGVKGRAFYTQKDKAMAQKADYGLVLWDGKSQGSANNLTELLRQHKKALVYHAVQKRFVRVASQADLLALSGKEQAERSFGQSALAL